MIEFIIMSLNLMCSDRLLSMNCLM